MVLLASSLVCFFMNEITALQKQGVGRANKYFLFHIAQVIAFSLEHKYEIVKRLQARKHICGMTGDGVNDAPALKKADIGIAVADATDAARSASDIVLTEPGLSVIISAVLTSRAIFQRMKNYTVCDNVLEYYFLLLFCLCYLANAFSCWQIYAVSITIRIVVSFLVFHL